MSNNLPAGSWTHWSRTSLVILCGKRRVVDVVTRFLCLVVGALQSIAMAQPLSPPATADELRKMLTAMGSVEQSHWLANAYESKELARASDAQLEAILQAVDGEVLFLPARRWLAQNPDYEFVMLRLERTRQSEQLPDLPERMFVRYQHSPRALYAVWQDGGARSGQEVLYDSSIDARTMLAHLGGFLGKISMRIDIDGAIARSQSRHTVLNIGFQFILNQLQIDIDKLKARAMPSEVTAIVVRDGEARHLEVTFTSPGWPDFYAKKTRLRLDLDRPVIRLVESQDNEGKVFERSVFEVVKFKQLATDALNPKNPAYRF